MSGAATARAIAQDVRTGVRTAQGVADVHLSLIDDFDAGIGAFLHVDPAGVRAQAGGITGGRLAGVPVAVKDVLCTAGVPTTCGSRILEGWRPPYSATVVKRLHRAGAVVIGKTNMDEFAMGSSCENSAYQLTRNPHATDRVPGGSSGGSAAAVAAGFAPLALGTDTGGSIRQPASLCGVVGMKPTYGRVSRYGLVAFASSLDQVGPFATNVRDAALLYETIAGPDPLDATCLTEPLDSVTAEIDKGVDGLTFGVVRELSGGEAFEAAVLDRFGETLAMIERAGGKLVDVSLPASAYALSAYYLIAPAEASANLARFDGVRYGLRVPADSVEAMNRLTREAGFGAEVKRRIMLGTYALSAGYYDAYYGQAQRVRTLVIRDFAAAYEQADVLVSPTSPTVAFPVGARTANPLAMYMSDLCTVPSNLSGHPAISIWCGDDPGGLPVGFQLMAPALAEGLLFRAAAGVEALTGTRTTAEVAK